MEEPPHFGIRNVFVFMTYHYVQNSFPKYPKTHTNDISSLPSYAENVPETYYRIPRSFS